MSDPLLYSLGRDVFGPLVGGAAVWASNWLVKRRKPVGRYFSEKSLKLSNDKDVRIHEKLAELKFRLGAIRAYLIRFHNGSTYADDIPFLRKSRTHEVVSDGYARFNESGRFAEVPLSLLPYEMKLIIEPGHSFTLVQDIAPGTAFWAICVAGRAGAICRCKIIRGKEIVGAIGLDWDLDTKAPPEGLELVEQYAHLIEAIFAW